MMFSTMIQQERVLLLSYVTRSQTQSLFPMAKPCHRFFLKRRWRNWHKHSGLKG